MAAPARKKSKPTSLRRRALLGKVHIAKNKLGLSDDEYRGIIASQFEGKTSAKDLSDRRLVALIEHFKTLGFRAPAKKKSTKGPARAGSRPLAPGEVASKIRALWLSLYNLGIVRDPAEAAMATFVTRMSGVSAIQWLDPDSAIKVIEALKDWATREAFVNWEAKDGRGRYIPPKARVLAAQIKLLKIDDGEENDFLSSAIISLHEKMENEDPVGRDEIYRQMDQVIEALGQRIRKGKK